MQLETNEGQRLETQRQLRDELSKLREPDFRVENHGSIVLLQPLTVAANEWVDEHLPEDAMRFAGAVVIEPRYVADIVTGIQDDGLVFAV